MQLLSKTKSNFSKKLRLLLNIPPNKKQEMLRIALPATKAWRIHGHYLEFGVYQGQAFIEAFTIADRIGLKDMRFFAFDSFEGLPDNDEAADTGKFKGGQFAFSQEQFLENLRKAKVDLDRVQCIKGFYSDSLTKQLQDELLPMKAAVVWVDCDLYESTVPVLDFIVPFLQTGTIICYDDWFSFASHPMKGEIRATREWLERNPGIQLTQYRDFGVSGRSFVVHTERDEG
jgi:O-methyltransferase